MSKYRVTDAQYAQALAAGQAEAEAEFRPKAVRYVPTVRAPVTSMISLHTTISIG
jgi:hypothetical protein